MMIPPRPEFARYRLVRDAQENVITLPTQGTDEKIYLVLDGERWGFARLHHLTASAGRSGMLEALEKDLRQVAEIRSEHLSRVIVSGREGEDLYYVDEMQDGEPLPAYLERTGGIPVAVACEWVAQFLSFFQSNEALPPSLRLFSPRTFELVMNRQGRLSPVLSRFTGWTGRGAGDHEETLAWRSAQLFCSLIAGGEPRLYHRDSLPRPFEELDPSLREAILGALDENGGNKETIFEAAMRSGGLHSAEAEAALMVPQMPLREWLRRDLEDSYEGFPEHALDPHLAPKSEPYAIVTRLRGTVARLQVLPGPGAIVRDGWLNQHHDATRRPGRGSLHQLRVTYLEDRDSITLIGEEYVEGVDLGALVRETGPLALESAKGLAAAINAALDALEAKTGASVVSWLPAENVLLLTGSSSLSDSAALIESQEEGAWTTFPLKFRLHQTVSTLKEGVNLPSRVRQLSPLSEQEHALARRSAIALPLLWHLLCGTRFHWDRAIHVSDLVPAALAETLESFRQQLRDEPTGVPENLFLLFSRFELSDPAPDPAPAEVPENTPVVGEHVATEEADDRSDEVLVSTVNDPVIVGAEPEPEWLPEELPIAAAEPSGDAFLEAKREEGSLAAALPFGETMNPSRKGSAGVVSFWAFVSAVVLACHAGYFLAGWSDQQGRFPAGESALFPIPDFRVLEGDPSAEARFHLENLLLSVAEPEALTLLGLLDHLDHEENQNRIETWLKARPEAGLGEAARVLGFLAAASGVSPEISSGYFLDGAKRGDLESQFRYAVAQWSDETGPAEATEALPLLEMAARGGHDASQELLARVKLSRDDGAGARQWATSAARQGRASAGHLLGLFNLKGIGGEVDPIEAVAHLRSAADRGDEGAMYDYGRCLSEARGVEVSFPEAQRWMRLAASRGHKAARDWCLARGLVRPNESAP